MLNFCSRPRFLSQAAREAVAKNSSHSSFISRQVAEHVNRFRTLTVPELREEAARRKLNKNGKRQQLLMRLAIWTRDEVVKSSSNLEQDFTDNPDEDEGKLVDLDEGSDSSDDSSCSSADELEIFHAGDSNEKQVDDSGSSIAAYENDQRKSDEIEGSLSTTLHNIFGHESFRHGQEWAIQRCLSEKKSLLVAPTGFGKSLCYALPSALMDGLCIVVSPLISLIQDQLRSLPPRIPAATLSGSVSASKTAAILNDVMRNRLKILFVSPERLTSPAFRRLFNERWNSETKTKERSFPEISLLCIDEAHCISQWAHNFRPCFLRFKGLVHLMKPKSILAITATAGPKVIADIRQTLGIQISSSTSSEIQELLGFEEEDENIKIIRLGRDNIDVKCKFLANHEERLAHLAEILSPIPAEASKSNLGCYAGKLCKGSVIIYVWRQKDTEAVAESLLASGVKGGVVVYHGGMDSVARAKSQNKFMRGKARICVATVAFGMGIDKADVIGVSPTPFLAD
jgi:ATP-dependent DNA helicase Q4